MRRSLLKINESGKLLLLSLVVGLGAGFSAVLLIKSIDFLQSLVSRCAGFLPGKWAWALFPSLGMLLSLLIVRYLVKDNIGHGVTQVLLAVSRHESRIKPHNIWSSLLTSALTIGLGGSVGAEAPIVYTGAAFGSNVGRWAGVSYKGITTLLGCGAAGAIAGIFKAPLAGVLFTLEILLFNISMSSIIPLLISTLTATVVSYLFLGQGAVFEAETVFFKMQNLPLYLALGIFCAGVSLYFTKFTLFLEDKVKRISSPWLKWFVCSLGLGALIMIFPQLFGEGYDSIRNLLAGKEEAVLLVLALVIFKVVSMTLTNSGGGVGGTFGPTLVVGGLAGFLLAKSFNLLGTGWSVPEQSFVLVGMAGVMAGVMQAPMTAIFLIAEITGGYSLLIPLILCSTVSYAVTRIWEKYSIYTKRIAQSGDLLTHDSDQAVMTLLQTRDLIRDKYPRLRDDSTLEEILPIVSSSTVAVFPVLDRDGRFCGMLEMDDLRKYIFDIAEHRTTLVSQLMHSAPDFVYEDEKMSSVMRKFDVSDVWRLPVITHEGIYLGFISRSRILAAYRAELKLISED